MRRNGVTDLADRLSDMGVPPRLVEAALRVVSPDAIGLLVYGSRARADFVQNSDLDLLALVSDPTESGTCEGVNLVSYTPEQFLSASGTLFGMHIRRDGVVISDTTGALQSLIAKLEAPDPSELLSRVRHLSAILDAGETELDLHLPGLCRLARYLLRTAIYSLALAEGRPCFSVRELAERFADPDLVALLSSDPGVLAKPSLAVFAKLRKRLRVAVGRPSSIPYRSLESLVVAEWDDDRDRSTLAILAMTCEGDDVDYAELPKVLL